MVLSTISVSYQTARCYTVTVRDAEPDRERCATPWTPPHRDPASDPVRTHTCGPTWHDPTRYHRWYRADTALIPSWYQLCHSEAVRLRQIGITLVSAGISKMACWYLADTASNPRAATVSAILVSRYHQNNLGNIFRIKRGSEGDFVK